MNSSIEKRLNAIARGRQTGTLHGGLKGLEKESLRVTPQGNIAQTPHPEALGSALTHPHITTDYSEALLEFVTDAFAECGNTMGQLSDIHQFIYHNLGDEMLWATSMPCVVNGDGSIPIAHYGTSNVGMMKHIYRRGLDCRYGRTMQAIAGIHFNYSLPAAFWPVFQAVEGDNGDLQPFISHQYFRLIRNFQRLGWLVPFLFGASPAVCKSFLKGRDTSFVEFDPDTLYEPSATSLRMSDIGYKNKAQSGLGISYNSLDDYLRDLTAAINTPDPEYSAIGTMVDREYRQLNANVLQIENEYYSFVRPKQPARSGESPSRALRQRGVKYVEIRALDLNPFQPTGTDRSTLRFMEAFLLYCLLGDSPPIDEDERLAISQNQANVARRGRDPELVLHLNGEYCRLRDWAGRICDGMQAICDCLDEQESATPYSDALADQRAAVADSSLTPSARVLRDMREHGENFVAFAMRVSEQHKKQYLRREVDSRLHAQFEAAARESLAQQANIEAADDISFETYLARYFEQQ